MLYQIAVMLREDFGALNLFTYVTSRSVFAALTAMFVGMAAYPPFIRWQRAASLGQPVRRDGPATHFAKEGTPTMGGAVIIASLLTTSLLWGDVTNSLLVAVLATTVAFALIGLLDDWYKLRRRSDKGLRVWAKFVLQSLVAVALLSFLWWWTPVGEHGSLLIPYWKNLALPLGATGFFVLGWLCLVGSSNAVNLADGLDGLAILPAVVLCLGLGVLAYVAGNAVFSGYLSLPYISGAQELVVFCAALAGAGLAFLWFNATPAQVFMGDTGALAIGVALASVAVIIRQEIVFAVMSGLFVLEAVSVILQVASFKLTGRRIFLMAPVHHHFEKKGWPENVVVVRFWIVTIMLVLVGLASLKIR